jgi:hypothetical protein
MEPSKGWLQSLFLGDVGQQLQLHDLQNDVEQIRGDLGKSGWSEGQIRELAERVLDLHLRLGVLVRLLIAKGVIRAEEFAPLIADSRTKPKGDSPEPGAAPNRGG